MSGSRQEVVRDKSENSTYHNPAVIGTFITHVNEGSKFVDYFQLHDLHPDWHWS